MNIDDVVRIHSNIQKWLLPHSFSELIGIVVTPDEIRKWSKGMFRNTITSGPPGQILMNELTKDILFTGLPYGIVQKVIEAHMGDTELWTVTNMVVAYSLSDIDKLRKIDYDARAASDDYRETIRQGKDVHPILLSMLNIKPEIENRDEELTRFFGSFYDLFTANTQEECADIAKTDAIQLLRRLPEIADFDRKKRSAYGWACTTDKDDIKAAIAPVMINGVMHASLGRMIADRWQQAIRESSSKDKAVNRYHEEIIRYAEEAKQAKDDYKKIAAQKTELEKRVAELEARPQTIVPSETAHLQKELEAAQEYENLFNLSDAENKELKIRVQALEGQLAGINAQAQQRHARENGMYEDFALYATREGYDADLAAAILRTNAHFRSNNMVPRSMMKKNTESALEDKSKIKDFDKTLKWLASLGAYNQKGDAFSTTIKFSDIPVSDVRMYVSMLVGRET